MMTPYSLTVTGERAGHDLQARFAEEPMTGPMRSPRTQMVADAAAALLSRDPGTLVSYEPITGIDTVSMRPNPHDVEHRMIIRTSVPRVAVEDTFRASEAAMIQTVEAAGGEYN